MSIHRILIVAVLLHAGVTAAFAQSSPEQARSRRFRFDYRFEVLDLPIGKRLRAWVPKPKDGPNQRVRSLGYDFKSNSSHAELIDCGRFVCHATVTQPPSGRDGKTNQPRLSYEASYEITREEHLTPRANRKSNSELTKGEASKYLSANRLVPISGRPLELLGTRKLPIDEYQRARMLYDLVEGHVDYDKSKPGYGNGDSVWVCDSRTGNCTDFHSLFISLARAQGIPARFHMGFPLPRERGSGSISGYHCWAEFFCEDYGWVPVDISEADKHPEKREYFFGNLTEDRVLFTTGRDIVLEPRQTGPPLNYFIYPYVEVDGQPWPPGKINMNFEYKDLDETLFTKSK